MIETHERRTRAVACFLAIMFFAYVLTPIAIARDNYITDSDNLCIPISVNASHFIQATTASMSAGNNGNVTVAFSITGTGRMTEIGSTRIEIRENGTLVGTYLHANTPGMMGVNRVIHGGTVTYRGVAGRSYRAIVTLRAANNNGSDNRTLQTNSVIAR